MSGTKDKPSTDVWVRRAATATVSICVVLFLGAIAFGAVNTEPGATSWGSGSPWVMVALVLAVCCFPVVGALITHRHPRSTIGWLLLAVGVLWAWSGFADAYLVYAVHTNPGRLPSPAVVGATADWIWVPAIGLMGTFLILLFPDGHLPSPRWRVVAWVSAITTALGSASVLFRPGPMEDLAVTGLDNPWGIPALEGGGLVALSASLIVFPLCIVACAAGLVVRFRRSSGVERLQLKWLAAAGGFVAALYLVAMAATLGFGQSTDPAAWVRLTQDAALISFGVIPVAIGVAILKHRLYGIDVVINKALVFGALASFITAVYVGIVVGLGSLVGRGGEPNLALSIAATAVVAVAFQPVRDRVQRFANRLVYGERATPYEVLAHFADRMGGTYDADELLPLMARTIAQGVGADRVEVWLAIGSGLAREASWPSLPGRTSMPARVTGTADLLGGRVVPVRHQGELLGAFVVVKPSTDPVNPAEEKLVDDVAAQTGLVLRNVRLIEELRSSRQRLVTTQDEERRRLERDLHNGAQQSLVAVSLVLRTARARWSGRDEVIGNGLDRASEQLSFAVNELRELARGIHPAILTDRGLGPALRSLAERSAVPVVVEDQLAERLEGNVEVALYFVVSEALTNVAKYAAAGEVSVRLTRLRDVVELTVADDGVGGADAGRGSGLRGLADRVAVVDGTLEINSPQGRGTRLTCRIPVTAAPAPEPLDDADPQSAIPLGVGQ